MRRHQQLRNGFLQGLEVATPFVQQVRLFRLGGVGEFDLGDKTIELGFREGIGAELFHPVHGGQHHEQFRQGVLVAINTNDLFLHGFEEGRLDLGCSPVDFIG